MADVRYENATRIYPGTDVPAVDALDLHIEDGELMVLVGPSGSGKSTALRMLAGLEDVDDGGIWIGGTDVTYARPQGPRRRDGLPELRALPVPDRRTRTSRSRSRWRGSAAPSATGASHEVAALLELTDLLERKPGQLSGGQRQRVAMGRAIVREPSVYLMDEPLSNLDAKLRVQMRADIAALQARLGVTTVYVTHDQSEAMTLGSRVAVLRDGQLQQCAPPRELYERPANAFVAGFIGSPAMSLVEVPLGTNGSCDLAGVRVPLARGDRLRPRRAVGCRASSSVSAPRRSGSRATGIPAEVEAVEVLGADAYVFCTAEIAGAETRLTAARRRARARPSAARRCGSSRWLRRTPVRPRDGRAPAFVSR